MIRVIIWAALALAIGIFGGYYFGYSFGYDQAATTLNLAASLK